MSKRKLILILGLVTLSVFSACDQIENTDRTVVISTMHPPAISYRFDVGLNEAQSVVSWPDTSAEVSVTVDAQAGDAIYYLMTTEAPGAELNITVDGIQKLIVDLNGSSPNTAAGFLVLD